MRARLGLSEPSIMMQLLAWELVRCVRYKRVASILLISMDRPDESLMAAAARTVELDGLVRDNTREVDLVGTHGEGRLLVLLPETGKQGACAAAERLRGLISRQLSALPAPPRLAPTTVSIGVAAFPEDGDSAEGLVRAAERALAEAVATGGNRVTPAGLPFDQRLANGYGRA